MTATSISALHWIDYTIIAILALSALTGLVRGFIKEIVALSVWVAAGWLAFAYAKPVSAWLGAYIHDKTAQVVLAYIVIIVGTLLIGGILNTMLSFMMHHSGLNGTDRLLGLGFGAVRGVFVVALILVVVRISALPEEEYRKQSQLYAYFTPVVNWLYRYTPDLIKRVEELDHHKGSPKKQKHVDVTVRDFETL